MGTLQYGGRRYIWGGSFAERLLPKEAGFRWSPDEKIWWTDDHRKAEALRDYMLKSALDANATWRESLEGSRATDADIEIPVPEGLSYLPYQKAGIAYAAKTFNQKEAAHYRHGVLIADEMGL